MARTVYERADVIPLITEAFRELGYDGASMSRITERTGLGKSSLYHFFPGGKEEMAAAVLADVDDWFERHIFLPLRQDAPEAAIETMWRAVDDYFRSGRRACLVGAFALDETRDRFAVPVANYFRRWIASLETALVHLGQDPVAARADAEATVLGIQGAIVLSRSLDDPGVFTRAVQAMASRLAKP